VWRILLDVKGEDDDSFLVRHMSMVVYTSSTRENEYLFVPYSVFTLVNVKWSSDPDEVHEIDIQASIENLDEDETLELAPWY